MGKRFKSLLIGTAVFASCILAGAPAVFADPGNGNAANTPGRNKTTSSTQTQSTGTNGSTTTTSSSTSTSSPGNSNRSQGNAGTGGAYNQPQPYSKADTNNTGANTTSSTNPYKSIRNGSLSLNGNGRGQATGKPCAGCVGKADNKFPPGQAPNGSDLNKGYECDANHGIGKSNPAHTGCAAAPVLCLTNCGDGTGGGGRSGCVTNCSSLAANIPIGRGGGGRVLGIAATVAGTAAAIIRPVLPNTGAPDTLNLWALAAVIGFAAAAIYWRQLVQPLLRKR